MLFILFKLVLSIVIAAIAVSAILIRPALATTPYIPARDPDAVNWAATFAAAITADPGAYGLTAGDAVTIQAASDAFAAAYALGGGTYHAPVNPATKTPTTTQAKVDARVSMEFVLRPFAIQISRNAGITADAKIAIGVNPRTSIPTPIAAPTSFPALQLIGGTPLQLTLQYKDSEAITGKAKPFGALQLQVYAEASDTPITDPDAINFFGVATKSPFAITFGSADAGKTAYIVCRWITRTGLTGPWSMISHATVMGA